MLIARVFALSLLLFPVYVLAEQGMMEANKNVAAVELRLRITQVKLAQALDQLAKKSGIPVHYSMLPEQFITADCAGKIKVVLTCLLGGNVDMIYRYQTGASNLMPQTQPIEVWILEVPALFNQSESAIAGNQEKKQQQQIAAENKNTDNTELLLERAKNPTLRMEAIADLAMAGGKDNVQVRTVLRDALYDRNPGVRLQAVLAIAQREGEEALADMQRAMSDENADVRRMAVERVGNNYLLLEQALKDNDPNIRLYAATKLALLNKANNDN